MADDGNSSGPASFVWAIALVIIVAILAAVIWQAGLFASGDKKINVEIKAPAPAR